MWWREIASLDQSVRARIPTGFVDPDAEVEAGVTIDERDGPVHIGANTKICSGAIVRGPAVIGANCMIGNGALLRGPLSIGGGVRIGFAAEIKNAIIADEVAVGPMCFVADSRVDDGAYLGAMVRTSNQRLDRASIAVLENGQRVPTGLNKLGCWIGAGSALGIHVIILPGRVVAAGSLFEPRITITRNLPPGHYRIVQEIEQIIRSIAA